ncbi:hypothetical protein B5K11_04860 [Rhizobium leguminosarum bv. trifolii]|nr:hypothetical protein B5K11_04860 [Rhizobium leguminosarum bv. trifolii]
MGKIASSCALIPVLVTGIQPPRVGAVNDSCNAEEFLAPKDLGALDSCDEHRNEGGDKATPHGSERPFGTSRAASVKFAATPFSSNSPPLLRRRRRPLDQPMQIFELGHDG